MGRVAQALQPKKARLQALMDGVASLEARVQKTAPIQVIRVRDCEHEGCGCLAPSEAPVDALIIHVGCRYAIPPVTLPEGEQRGSRAERKRPFDDVGKGLPDDQHKRLLERIKLL